MLTLTSIDERLYASSVLLFFPIPPTIWNTTLKNVAYLIKVMSRQFWILKNHRWWRKINSKINLNLLTTKIKWISWMSCKVKVMQGTMIGYSIFNFVSKIFNLLIRCVSKCWLANLVYYGNRQLKILLHKSLIVFINLWLKTW